MSLLNADPTPVPAPPSERPVLLVDADSDQRRRLAAQLQNAGYIPVIASSGEDALECAAQKRFVFSLVAVRLPGMSGIDFVRRARTSVQLGAVIMIAEPGMTAPIVEAIQAGADNVVRRPCTVDDVEATLRGQAGSRPRAPAAPPTGNEEATERLERELALLVSSQTREMKEVMEQAARADVTVLVCGDTGVGKELVARAIHVRSARRRAPFIKVNCAAVPRELLESELFGHERGAFTGAHERKPGKFELAHSGTIFLDEIGELHPALQAKMLHVLQDGEFSRIGGRHNVTIDVRVICATNRDLAREVAANRFREDLFYRLNVINIFVPPLRERSDEIPGLTQYFVGRYARAFGVPECEIPPETMDAFMKYAWPGNVRELENVIKRMLVLKDLSPPRELREPATVPVANRPDAAEPFAATKGLSLKEISRRAVLEAEREAIRRALEQNRWNRVKTARMLKISYRALLYKIKDMGLKQDLAAS